MEAKAKAKITTYMKVNRKDGVEYYKAEDNQTIKISKTEYNKGIGG